MRGVRFFFLIPTFLTLANCSPVGKASNHQPGDVQTASVAKPEVSVEVPESVTPAPVSMSDEEWIPDWQVVCKASYCPPQVGLLVRPRLPQDGLIRFKRCTASLVGTKWVMTAGHCDGDVTGYFITQKINGKKFQRKLKSPAIYKHYVVGTMNPDTGKEIATSGEMDIAVFEMEDEIPETAIKSFSIAEGKGQDLEQFFAYVINRSENENEFQIEERICKARRHEGSFPYSLSENPDVIMGFDCSTEEGNSGAPILAGPHATQIEAVLIGGTSYDKAVQDIRDDEKREPYIFEKHAYFNASNVRCAGIPGRADVKGCVRVNEDERDRRFKEYQDGVLNSLLSRQVPDAGRYGYRYKPRRVQIKYAPVDFQFEMFYKPVCRTATESPTKVDFPVENLLVKFDEWGKLSLESKDIKIGAGKVTDKFANEIYKVQVDWPAPLGEFEKPDSVGLRELWGPSFNIALPICGG